MRPYLSSFYLEIYWIQKTPFCYWATNKQVESGVIYKKKKKNIHKATLGQTFTDQRSSLNLALLLSFAIAPLGWIKFFSHWIWINFSFSTFRNCQALWGHDRDRIYSHRPHLYRPKCNLKISLAAAKFFANMTDFQSQTQKHTRTRTFVLPFTHKAARAGWWDKGRQR